MIGELRAFDSRRVSIALSDGSTVHVHKGLLSTSSSAYLKAVVSGNYREGHGEDLDWTHEDPATVCRLITHLYTNDYYVELPEEIEPSTGDSGPVVNEERKRRTPTPTHGTFRRPTPKSYQLTPLSEYFSLETPVLTRPTDAGRLAASQETKRKCKFASTIVAHAQVYVLADYHGLVELSNLSLQRLVQTLDYAGRNSDCIENEVIALAEFTFNQFDPRGGERLVRPRNLQDISARFAAVHFVKLSGEEWSEVLEQSDPYLRFCLLEVCEGGCGQQAGGCRHRRGSSSLA